MAMAQKKKRNKKYTGQDAAVTKTTVTRISAPERSAFGEWWNDNKANVISRVVFYGVVLALIGIIWAIAHFIIF